MKSRLLMALRRSLLAGLSRGVCLHTRQTCLKSGRRVMSTAQSGTATWRFGAAAAATLVGGGFAVALATQRPAHAESEEGVPQTSETLTDKALKLLGLYKWVEWVVEPADRAGCPPGKLLPDPPALPPGVVQRTLVLGLEDCLIHTEWERRRGHRTKKRPGLEAFLAHMSQYYEIVIFTTAMSSYAQPIAYNLQDIGYVQHSLFRESCKYVDGRYVKDLSYLNRDLRHVIIVDTNPDSYSKQPHNAIHIKEWNDDLEDTELLALVPFLEAVWREDIPDVREVLQNLPADSVPESFRKLRHQALERKKNGTSLLGRAARTPHGVLPVLTPIIPRHAPTIASPIAPSAPAGGAKAKEATSEQKAPETKNIFQKAKDLH